MSFWRHVFIVVLAGRRFFCAEMLESETQSETYGPRLQRTAWHLY